MKMKTALMMTATLALFAGQAHATQKTRANLESGFTSSFPNASHITAATLLSEMNNVADSCMVLSTDTPLSTANGGTGIAYFTAAGPTVARIFTFPDAAATVLTSNAAVTVAQGGTGIASGTSGGVPYYSGTSTIASSGALASGALLLGGGTGAAPTSGTATEDGSGNLASVGTIASGAHTITSASATALTVGLNGATNPVLSVVDSTGSQADGISITGGATTAGTTIQAISNGSTSPIAILSKSTANATFGTGGGGTVNLSTNGSARVAISGTTTIYTPGASGTLSHSVFTQPADLAISAGANLPSINVNLAANARQHGTGALTLQEHIRVTAPTQTFVGASTATDEATFAIDGPPICGTFATCTNAHALYIPTEALTNTANGNGIRVTAPTGGTTSNYALNATGGSIMDVVVAGGTKFTASGCTNSNTHGGATAGDYTSGTTGACTVVITIGGATGYTAPTGWSCWGADRTTPANIYQQSASSTTTATMTGTTVTGDVISFGCVAY